MRFNWLVLEGSLNFVPLCLRHALNRLNQGLHLLIQFNYVGSSRVLNKKVQPEVSRRIRVLNEEKQTRLLFLLFNESHRSWNNICQSWTVNHLGILDDIPSSSNDAASFIHLFTKSWNWKRLKFARECHYTTESLIKLNVSIWRGEKKTYRWCGSFLYFSPEPSFTFSSIARDQVLELLCRSSQSFSCDYDTGSVF